MASQEPAADCQSVVSPQSPPPRRSALTRLVIACAIVASLVAASVWIRQRWLVVTYRIAGGSMAEALVGEHVELTCIDCGFSFRCGATELPRDDIVNCPNCGLANDVARSAVVRPGQLADVDRWKLWTVGPRRWDLVALAQPGSPGEFAVKRVVGLPGEVVTIVDGRVVIGEEGDSSDAQRASCQPAHKPWPKLWESAVTVYDDSHRARRATAPARWIPLGRAAFRSSESKPELEKTDWQATDRGFYFAPSTASDSAANSVDQANVFEKLDEPQVDISVRQIWDWLEYRHYPTFAPANSPAQQQESPIVDYDAYNPSLSRRLNHTTDLGLSARVTLTHGSRLVCEFLQLDDRKQVITTRFELMSAPPQVKIWRGMDDANHGALLLERSFELANVAPTNSGETDERVAPLELDVSVAVRANDVHCAVAGHGVFEHYVRSEQRDAGKQLREQHHEEQRHDEQRPDEQQPSEPSRVILRPVAIGAAGGAVEVRELKLWRDLFYLPPIDGPQSVARSSDSTRETETEAKAKAKNSATWRLGPDEYFVLGDNPPLSIDSRHWKPGSVTRGTLLGIVRPLAESPRKPHTSRP